MALNANIGNLVNECTQFGMGVRCPYRNRTRQWSSVGKQRHWVILGAGLGNLFFAAPLPYRISSLATGIWLSIAILGAILATDTAATPSRPPHHPRSPHPPLRISHDHPVMFEACRW